jgi:hypothetical protein
MPVETIKLRLRALLAIVSASAPTMAAEIWRRVVLVVW